MYQGILKFWFDEIDNSRWWIKDNNFDQAIKNKFGQLHKQAVICELYFWRKNPKGRLAEIIVLDQFSRNIYRDTPQAFSADSMALALSQEAIAAGVPSKLSPIENSFLYMPFMHSESLAMHQVAESLYEKNGIKANYEFELKHKEIIKKFGRYPHRNDILGRRSTADEVEFLKQPGSSF